MVFPTLQYWSTGFAVASNSEVRRASFMVTEEVDHYLCNNALSAMV